MKRAHLTVTYSGTPTSEERVRQVYDFSDPKEVARFEQSTNFDLEKFPEVEKERESLVDRARSELDRMGAKLGMKPTPDKTQVIYGTHGSPRHPIEHWYSRSYE